MRILKTVLVVLAFSVLPLHAADQRMSASETRWWTASSARNRPR